MSNIVKFPGGQSRPVGIAAAEQDSGDGIASPEFVLSADVTVSLSNIAEQLRRIIEVQARILGRFDACPARNAAEALVSEARHRLNS